MTATTAALLRAADLLSARLAELETRIASADEGAWPEYRDAAVALAQLSRTIAPGANGALLTTAQMAESLNVSTRQVRRLKKAGKLAPAIQLGARTLRWRAGAGG